MAFDSALAATISQAFRSVSSNEITPAQRRDWEEFLLRWFGLKNIRNAQLWTRFGAVQRNFINRNLGQYELDLRTFVAEKFINNGSPNFPTKQKAFRLPPDNQNAKLSFDYLNDNYIREYTVRIFFSGNFLIFEYAVDSNATVEDIDLDSPEFEDVEE